MAFTYQPRRKIGWKWPKDPYTRNSTRLGRLKDVLLNKGPDIFVGVIDGPSATPHMPRWSRWSDLYFWTEDTNDNTLPPIFSFADRGHQRYDFRTRKYRIPDGNTWSYVQYPDTDQPGDPNIPEFVWDAMGTRYSYEFWQQHFGGGHGLGV